MKKTEIEQAVFTEIYNLPLGVLMSKDDTHIEEGCNTKITSTSGETVLAILQKTGYLSNIPDVADLSENYKDHLN